MPADSFEDGDQNALVAPELGREVKGALRAALVEIAPGLVAAARKEEVGVRTQYWRQRSSAVSGDLRCGCSRHRRAADSVVIRGEGASGVELAQREESAADFQYVTQARVLGVKLCRRVAIASMLQDANQAAGLVGMIDYALIITTFGALVSVPDDLKRSL